MVSHVDLFPTICDLLDVPAPPWLQGCTMMPLFRGQAKEIHDRVFAEVTYHAAYEPMRAIRTNRYKYIRRFEDRGGPALPNCDDSQSKDVWLNSGWQERSPASEQLYDLVFDPNEVSNLAHLPSKAGTLAALRADLAQWMHQTADPLLQGPVPAPAGSRVNDPDGLSPREAPYIVP
jgi:arylsulfatase A-like enzyme